MSNAYQLRIKSRDDSRTAPTAGQAFDLNQPVITVGRDQSNDIVIDDNEISRFHARLTEMDEGYLFEDLNSTNGSSVNERAASGHVMLTPGDVISLGKHVENKMIVLMCTWLTCTIVFVLWCLVGGMRGGIKR